MGGRASCADVSARRPFVASSAPGGFTPRQFQLLFLQHCEQKVRISLHGLFGVRGDRELVVAMSLGSGDFSPNARLMHSRSRSSVRALAPSKEGNPSRPRSSTFERNSWSCSMLCVSSSTARVFDRARSDLGRAIECGEKCSPRTMA